MWLSANPELARILLQELTFYSSGKQAATFHSIRKRLIDGIEALVRDAKVKEDAALVARYIFFVYSASLRWWSATPKPDPGRGIAELRRLLRRLVAGLREVNSGSGT